MRFRYLTTDIGGIAYITESQFLAEREGPQADDEFARPLVDSLLDDNGKLQWALVPNPDYGKVKGARRFVVERRPQAETPEEIAEKAKAARKAKLAAELGDVLLDIIDKDEPISVLPTRLKAALEAQRG